MRDRTLDLSAPIVMGVVNLTPDSFSDGGELAGPGAAMERAEALVADGADLLDVGGESTRPGAAPVPAPVELDRILEFVGRAVGRLEVPVSVDTRKAVVARAALEAGASVVNDVSGLTWDPEMAGVVAEAGGGLVLMHMRGDPGTMRERALYHDLLGEVTAELRGSLERARAAGIPDEAVVVDPGLGFAKTADQSLTLLRDLDRLAVLGRPILVGPSRKSFLGAVLGRPPGERVEGTVAACVLAWTRGARIFRVHDVGPVRRALDVARAVEEGTVSR